MFVFLRIVYNMLLPYWDSLRKELAEQDIASLTIIHIPNLIGHPVGITILLALGFFVLPRDPVFYVLWMALVLITSVQLTFNIRGLLSTNFFGVQILFKLSFLVNTIFAIIFLGEHITPVQCLAILLALVGVIFFTWPKETIKKVSIDRGALFILGSVLLGGFSSIIYKLATMHTPGYTVFLSGRFVGDLIGWTSAWLVSLGYMKRSPISEFTKCIMAENGVLFAIGSAFWTLLGSWLVFVMPVSTYAMLGILTIPTSYILSRQKYKEKLTPRMWIGTVCIIGAVIVFIQ
jgi:drug/metabolite transporter (DMT)-like permease